MTVQAKVIYEGFSDNGKLTVRNAQELLKKHRLGSRFRPSAELSDREAIWLISLLKAIDSEIVSSLAMNDMQVSVGLGRDPVEVASADRAEHSSYVDVVLSVPPLREGVS